MARYQNKKTGAIIEVSSEMTGAWELIEPKRKEEPKKVPKKTEAKKK